VTVVAAGLALAALGLFVWSYLVYPPLVSRIAARRGERAESSGAAPAPASVEVILSAADEEGVIEARVRNLLGQTGLSGVAYRVAIGCDGCRDGTAEKARAAAAEAAGGPVSVVEFPNRRGKASVLNDLLAQSTADVVVFTDANTRFEPDAVARLLEALRDSSVGATCGRLVFEAAPGAPPTPESLFWDRETRLKEAEGRLGACLGANGGIYAAARALVSPLPPDTTSMDDFLIPARIARTGRRVTFAGLAVAREDAARDVAAEVRRRVRIGIGAGQVLRRDGWLWNFAAHPVLAFAFVSRKAARWLAPLLALAAAAAALAVPEWRGAGGAVLAAAAASLLLARARPGRPLARADPAPPGPIGRLYYFVVLNVALALGVALGLFGHSRPHWTRTARS
jgi:cellulose synthase/poly-beta-1,6-N-acetylglucosamine synthase-like glycosyltransferase